MSQDALLGKGFMLLPAQPISGYRGVDRNPFEPLLVDDQMDLSRVPEKRSGIWTFYLPGWRQDAYRLYEENAVEGPQDLFLLSDLRIARMIQQIIESHIGPHEILACEVWHLEATVVAEESGNFLGYDAAYPGGDFYSAVWNGLLCKNPDPILVNKYGGLLNQFGLFSSAKHIPGYIRRFKELFVSEVNSRFCLFHLSSV